MNSVHLRNVYLLIVCIYVYVCVYENIRFYECTERLQYTCAGWYSFINRASTDCNAESCIAAPRNYFGYFNVFTALLNHSGRRNKCVQVVLLCNLCSLLNTVLSLKEKLCKPVKAYAFKGTKNCPF